jgi:beta-1,4-mannosyl-glycoprotein beta-1,4-N-acetylglucosaminyltransferase
MNVDTLPFFNELDILELRLKELEDVVDLWVIVESPTTHSGIKKPLYLWDSRRRFKRWWPRIRHYAPQNPPGGYDPWVREHWQRERIKDVYTANADDIVIHSDADEIPKPDVFCRFDKSLEFESLDMAFFEYYLNGRVYERWRFGKIMTGDFYNSAESLQWVRFKAHDWYGEDWGMYKNLLSTAGWHFSWLGSKHDRIRKANSTSHYKDRGTEHFINAVEKESTPSFGPGCKVQPVKIDARWPKTVLGNIQHYKDLGWVYEKY